MPDHPPNQFGQAGQPGQWLDLVEAAPLLGLTPEALRKRLKRGRIEIPTRRANDGRWLVQVPQSGQTDRPSGQPMAGLGPASDTAGPNSPDKPAGADDVWTLAVLLLAALAERDARTEEQSATITDLRGNVADLRGHVAEQAERIADLRRANHDLRAEAERARAELAEERRRHEWPGLLPWLRRWVHGG